MDRLRWMAEDRKKRLCFGKQVALIRIFIHKVDAMQKDLAAVEVEETTVLNG
jgi:hypothetical protein